MEVLDELGGKAKALCLQMMKAMNKSNEHVLAGGACFNEKADSHLVCVQNDDGNYQTQAISIHNQPRKGEGSPGSAALHGCLPLCCCPSSVGLCELAAAGFGWVSLGFC